MLTKPNVVKRLELLERKITLVEYHIKQNDRASALEELNYIKEIRQDTLDLVSRERETNSK